MTTKNIILTTVGVVGGAYLLGHYIVARPFLRKGFNDAFITVVLESVNTQHNVGKNIERIVRGMDMSDSNQVAQYYKDLLKNKVDNRQPYGISYIEDKYGLKFPPVTNIK